MVDEKKPAGKRRAKETDTWNWLGSPGADRGSSKWEDETRRAMSPPYKWPMSNATPGRLRVVDVQYSIRTGC